MAVRVASTQMVYGYQHSLNTANNLQEDLLQQGDGSKLHNPSDNSVDYTKYMRYMTSANENDQYQKNVKAAISWMKQSDAAMVNMTDIMQTFMEKTTAAANDTNNVDDFAAISKEMLAEIQELVSLGNTQQGDRYVFAGQSDTTQPFSISTDLIQRGLTKTLDENQARFFTTADSSGVLSQMLELKDDAGETYYLSTTTGKVYTKQFMDSGYKDVLATGATKVRDQDAVGTVADFASGTKKVSDYFKNTGEIKDPASSLSMTTASGDVTLKFATLGQQVVTFTGDEKYISMVKQNGTTDPSSDTVNATAQELFGSDIFDDANSGNRVSGSAMLNNLLTVCAKTKAMDTSWLSSDGMTISDKTHATTINAETKMGARNQLYSAVSTMLDNQAEIITADITEVSAADVAKLSVNLMEAQTVFNLMLSFGSRILPQSLADYLH